MTLAELEKAKERRDKLADQLDALNVQIAEAEAIHADPLKSMQAEMAGMAARLAEAEKKLAEKPKKNGKPDLADILGFAEDMARRRRFPRDYELPRPPYPLQDDCPGWLHGPGVHKVFPRPVIIREFHSTPLTPPQKKGDEFRVMGRAE